MTLPAYVSLLVFLLGVALVYLQQARRFGIIDTPNDRSSHADRQTIRGGGVLIWVAALVAFGGSGLAFSATFLGLTLVAIVSFLDDLRPLSVGYRLVMQGIGIGLLLTDTGVFPNQPWVLFGVLIGSIGLLNACNFMDGINGMMALNSLVTVGTLWIWPYRTPNPLTDTLLPATFGALLVFSYFNVRRRAVWFAGDVGSISVAFVVLTGLLVIISQFQTYLPVLLLAVYGVDTGLTIGYRLLRRQPLFRAHRQHLFQQVVDRAHWPHVYVAGAYALVQGGINALVLLALRWSAGGQAWLAAGVLGTLMLVYVLIQRRLATTT